MSACFCYIFCELKLAIITRSNQTVDLAEWRPYVAINGANWMPTVVQEVIASSRHLRNSIIPSPHPPIHYIQTLRAFHFDSLSFFLHVSPNRCYLILDYSVDYIFLMVIIQLVLFLYSQIDSSGGEFHVCLAINNSNNCTKCGETCSTQKINQFIVFLIAGREQKKC